MNAAGLTAGAMISLVAVGGGFAPSARAWLPEGGTQSSTAAPAGPATEFSAWAAEQKGEIEAIVGAKFASDVPVKVASVDDVAQMIGKSIEVDMAGAKRANGAPMSEMEIRVRATSLAYKVATRTFGMYRYEDKVVYVVPENVRTYGKRHGWSEETVARSPRLAIAHELVHALQDQKGDLTTRLGKLTGEEQGALRAISEGQAVWATDQLAKKLDWTAANAVLWGVVTGVHADEEAGSKGQPAPVIRAAPSSEVYTLGKAFVEHHAAWTGEGPKGAARVWAVLMRPPTTLAQLKEPAKFEVKVEGKDAPAAPAAPPASTSPASRP